MADRDADLLIIGAGIVGLATALEATRRLPGMRVLVVDKEDHVAAHQTGHNSGVIHSGTLLQDRLAEGTQLRRRRCLDEALLPGARQFPSKNAASWWLPPVQEEVPRLEQLHQRGIANGVPGLRMMERDAVSRDRAALRRTAGAAGALDRHRRLHRRRAEICRVDPAGRRRDRPSRQGRRPA